MGRSGTSALARVLALCGGALPRNLLPANAGNPTGYWEPADAMELNELFLRAHGSTWYDLAPEPARVPSDDDRDAFVERIAAFLRDGVAPGGPMIVKEPRITALLPYWLEAADRAHVRVTIVQPLRAPAEVVVSLGARDGLDPERSLALWLKYTLLAERGSRAAGVARVFVRYDDLLRDWEAVVARCAAQLDVPLAPVGDARREIAAFLSPELRHHRTATLDVSVVDPALLAWSAELYGAMRAAPDGAPPPELADSLYDAYAGWHRAQ